MWRRKQRASLRRETGLLVLIIASAAMLVLAIMTLADRRRSAEPTKQDAHIVTDVGSMGGMSETSGAPRSESNVPQAKPRTSIERGPTTIQAAAIEKWSRRVLSGLDVVVEGNDGTQLALRTDANGRFQIPIDLSSGVNTKVTSSCHGPARMSHMATEAASGAFESLTAEFEPRLAVELSLVGSCSTSCLYAVVARRLQWNTAGVLTNKRGVWDAETPNPTVSRWKTQGERFGDVLTYSACDLQEVPASGQHYLVVHDIGLGTVRVFGLTAFSGLVSAATATAEYSIARLQLHFSDTGSSRRTYVGVFGLTPAGSVDVTTPCYVGSSSVGQRVLSLTPGEYAIVYYSTSSELRAHRVRLVSGQNYIVDLAVPEQECSDVDYILREPAMPHADRQAMLALYLQALPGAPPFVLAPVGKGRYGLTARARMTGVCADVTPIVVTRDGLSAVSTTVGELRRTNEGASQELHTRMCEQSNVIITGEGGLALPAVAASLIDPANGVYCRLTEANHSAVTVPRTSLHRLVVWAPGHIPVSPAGKHNAGGSLSIEMRRGDGLYMYLCSATPWGFTSSVIRDAVLSNMPAGGVEISSDGVVRGRSGEGPVCVEVPSVHSSIVLQSDRWSVKRCSKLIAAADAPGYTIVCESVLQGILTSSN